MPTYNELVQIAVNTAEQCPTCAGCRAAKCSRNDDWCRYFIEQGLCQKQLWRWRQEAGLQAALIIAQIQAGQALVLFEEES